MKHPNKQLFRSIARRTILFAVPLFILASVSVGSPKAVAQPLPFVHALAPVKSR